MICGGCDSANKNLRDCLAWNDVVIPREIAEHRHPDAVKVYKGTMVRLNRRGQQYKAMTDPAAKAASSAGRVVGEGAEAVVVDEEGWVMGYVHPGPSVGKGVRVPLNNYYTCSCCRCRGRATWCKTGCTPAACSIKDGSAVKTLHEHAMEMVAEECG